MAATKAQLHYDAVVQERARVAMELAFPGTTEKELGEALGVNQSTAHRWRAGSHQIEVKALLMIAEKLGCGLDDILQPPWLPSREERFWAYARERVLHETPAPSGEAQLPAKAAEGIAEAARALKTLQRNKKVIPADVVRITTDDGAEGVHVETRHEGARRRAGKRRTLR